MVPPTAVLSAFAPDIVVGPWDDLANRDGFSGARLWRHQDLCLKSWPLQSTPPEQLRFAHGLMRQARNAGLSFVPDIIPTRTGDSLVVFGSAIYDLVTWQPGSPALLTNPNDDDLAAAGHALAQIHNAWQPFAPQSAPCPGILRRVAALKGSLTPSLGMSNTILSGRPTGLSNLLTELQSLVHRLSPLALASLIPLIHSPLALQPCLCDIHADHLLFEGNIVTGLIDFGSCKIDHPAVDLARLLGSCPYNTISRRHVLLNAYAKNRPLSIADLALISILERSGAVVAGITWLERLTINPAAATPAVLARVEHWIRRLREIAILPSL